MDYSKTELLFVYNAKSGVMHTLMDFAHKMFSPETYPCSLCSLTYGNLGMKKVWADYVSALPLGYRFLYKDHVSDSLEGLSEVELPVILNRLDNSYTVLVSALELEQMTGLEELMHTLTLRMQAL